MTSLILFDYYIDWLKNLKEFFVFVLVFQFNVYFSGMQGVFYFFATVNPNTKQKSYTKSPLISYPVPTFMIIIFRDLVIFYQIFYTPQVTWSVILSNKHGIYELPHELLNDLRLRILGNYKLSGKYQNFVEL